MKNIKDFYVYIHKKATNGQVFYVGKGHGKRSKSRNRNQYWLAIVAKYGFYVEIIQDGLQEWYAFELEKEMISHYGRENLCNLTDGGEGPSNPSELTRKRMRDSHVGKKLPEEQKRKISISNIGRTMSDEARKKSSTSQKGRQKSEEARKNMSIAAVGRKASQETKNKLSAMRKGKKLRPRTPEEKQKLSIAVRAFYENKKAQLLAHNVLNGINVS